MLGHENLSSTQLYTRVSIKRLKDIHTATHPAAKLERTQRKTNQNEPEVDSADVLAALDEEADEDSDA